MVSADYRGRQVPSQGMVTQSEAPIRTFEPRADERGVVAAPTVHASGEFLYLSRSARAALRLRN